MSIHGDGVPVSGSEVATLHAVDNVFCVLGKQVHVVVDEAVLKGLVLGAFFCTKVTDSLVQIILLG